MDQPQSARSASRKRETFAAFAERKEAEAVQAQLAPWVTELDAHATDQRAVGNSWSRERFGGPFFVSPPASPNRPSTGLVFVESRDGNTVAANPSDLGGGETDKHVVYEGLSRVAADAVLAGAETIRGGRVVFSVWHPELVALRQSLGLPRHPIQVVATLRGVDIHDGLLFNVPELHVVVITVPEWADTLRSAIEARPWIDTIVMESPRRLDAALAELHGMGVNVLSCVGGRTLASQMLEAGLVDDLYLTRAPKEGGVPNTPLSTKPIRGTTILRKRGTGTDAGVTFEHVRV